MKYYQEFIDLMEIIRVYILCEVFMILMRIFNSFLLDFSLLFSFFDCFDNTIFIIMIVIYNFN